MLMNFNVNCFMLLVMMHLNTHNQTRKIYDCKTCQITFTGLNESKLHVEQFHPEQRPFWCVYCKKSFKFEHSLKIHTEHKHKPIKDEPSTPTPAEFLFMNQFNHMHQ